MDTNRWPGSARARTAFVALAVCFALVADAARAAIELRTASATAGGATTRAGPYRLDAALAPPPLGHASGGDYRLTIGILLPATAVGGTEPPGALFAHGFED